MAKRNKKKKTLYQKSLIIYTCILLVIAEFCIIYVALTLKSYESNVLDNYLKNLISDMTIAVEHNNADKYFAINKLSSKYEDKSNLNQGYKDLFKDSKITYKKSTDNVYDIYADDTIVATITLDDSKNVTKLGLLNYTIWKIKDVKTYTEEGLFKVDAYISSDYTLYINDIKVDDDALSETTKIEGYTEVNDIVSIPDNNHYVITGLSYEPEVYVTDSDGKKVDYKYEDGIYYCNSTYETDDYDDAMSHLNNQINPLEIAEKWSLFLTKDLSGELYGFYTLTPYLVEGTSLYKQAQAWATGVDITFTSQHNLENPIFKEEKMSNFKVYNKDTFSVDVHLEKNILVINGVTKNDILNETLYFAYFDGSYRLISMKTITD